MESGQRLALERLDGTRWRVPIEVTQDEIPGLKGGDAVRIEGFGAKAKVRPAN